MAKLYLFVGCRFFLCCISACTENTIEEPHDLSVQIDRLGYMLERNNTCDEKADTLNLWLVEYKSKLESNAKKFKDSCPSGKKSSYQCMSHQLLASGHVEVALQGCMSHERVHDAVVRLNQTAGIAVGNVMTH